MYFTSGSDRAFEQLMPVSYTHLDVYKRQAAANTGEHAVIIERIINKLMHKSLTESRHLAGTVVSVSQHGKIRVHAGIPAAVTPVSYTHLNKEYQEFSIKECGTLTNYLHSKSDTSGDEQQILSF